ncbi:MAG: hypothetical protein SGJ20_10720 [Planctomycetota bacterium]|nr:hypothetical protein [Planctomycetota bacterium]
MAARENQGLQIALIVSVMVSILLAVMSFMFSNNYREEVTKAKASETRAQAESQKATEAIAEANTLKQIIGYPETEKVADISTKYATELAKYAEYFPPNLPAADKNLNRLVSEMADTINKKHVELLAAQREIQKIKDDRQLEQTKHSEVVAVHSTEKEAAVSSAKQATDTFVTQVATLSQTKEEVISKLGNRDTRLAELQTDFEKHKQDADAKERQLIDTVTSKTTTISEMSNPSPTVPDGRIVWVHQRDNRAFINLGSADGLQRRMTFSVFDKNATDAKTAIKKGSIEVLSIRDKHLADARILETSASDPIISGDIIYTPLWHPGQTQHFAVAGFIDFDGDGKSDLPTLRDLISYNGGILDAVVDEKGRMTGAMNHQTRYMVAGVAPSEKEGAELIEPWSKMNSDAKKLGVPIIKVDEFLNLIGYTPRSNSVLEDKTSGPTMLRNRTYREDDSRQSGDSQKSGDSFRTRKPPARPSGDSAF